MPRQSLQRQSLARPDGGYRAGWLPLMRDEPRALATAASLASRAAQYLEVFAQPATEAEVAA
ncbi:hypothetical protein ACSD7O_24200 [Methylorubrum extorquens]|uniref:hypothetical protein n=1 Tax=Methylorubrum extorquens TaxID=408 RepID=UPI003F5F76BD